MAPLLLVANDLFYQYEHRIKPLADYLGNAAPLLKVSLVPPGLSRDGRHAPPGGFLRGWERRVIADRQPIIWSLEGTTLVRRMPLPGPLGPLVNLALLRRALEGRASRDSIALAQGPVAGRACLGLGLRMIYDHADDYGGGRVGALHRRLLGTWQDEALRAAIAVSCAGPSLHRHAVETGAPVARLFPNGVDTQFFGRPRSESLQPSILYFGGIERDCGLDFVLRALRLMDGRISLTVGGEGSARRVFTKLADRLGISSRVTWLGGIPREGVPTLMTQAWVGLAVLPPTRWNRYAFHLKILEYMAAGLPFVTTAVGDGARIAEETGAGHVSTLDAPELARCLTQLIEDAKTREEMSMWGRHAAVDYEWAAIGPRYADWVLSVLAASG